MYAKVQSLFSFSLAPVVYPGADYGPQCKFCGIMKLALSQQALIAICNCQVEPVCSEVWHPRGDPRALEAQQGCVQARKAEHLQES